MTEEQVAQALIITSLIEHDKAIAICCPQQKWCMNILQAFYALHEELPNYLKVPLIRQQKLSAELDNGTRIYTASNLCNLRGIALNRAYVHEELSGNEEIMDVLRFCLMTSKNPSYPNNLVWFSK